MQFYSLQLIPPCFHLVQWNKAEFGIEKVNCAQQLSDPWYSNKQQSWRPTIEDTGLQKVEVVDQPKKVARLKVLARKFARQQQNHAKLQQDGAVKQMRHTYFSF